MRGARIFGHPVHVMLIHFPIGLWPAHFALHLFARQLPPQVSAIAGFWALALGTLVGWLAASLGAWDLLALVDDPDPVKLNHALKHAAINGAALLGFTVFAAYEISRYPKSEHGYGFLLGEAALLAAMAVGNYFGGAVVWHRSDA